MANKWTKEQKQAIDIEGCNVLVSAGAGSGKTAVLSERVLRKVRMGIPIDKMLILTFTKAAAKEMRDRIRNKLIENDLWDQVDLLDSSYITTFDSYSLSIVKKYHYLLNLSSDVSITDSVYLDILKRDILEEIMNENYEKGDSSFKDFVCHFSLKDDCELVDSIIRISNKLDLRYDKYDFLKNYMDTFYSDSHLNKLVSFYEKVVLEEKNLFNELSLQLKEVLEDKKLANFQLKVDSFLEADTYNTISSKLTLLTLPRSNGYSDDAKVIHDKLKASKDSLMKLCIYENLDSVKEELRSTYSDTQVLVRLLISLLERVNERKKREGLYDFNDISHLAITLVQKHLDVQQEIRDSFQEILIDEYQDTSDNQELFISLISHDNVYAVGDIKQSIYRFRNANPYIFKNKYDTYGQDITSGVKIDLNKNFRSRCEVLSNINMLFENVMDDFIGGADYKKNHKAVFGNISYNEEGHTEQNYNLEVYTYDVSSTISNLEKEIFIIAEDIQNKIDSKYQIFDKDKKILRDACYDDFVILLDKKRDFDLYKKIFEHLNIPLTLLKEETIHNTDDFLILHNLFKLVLKVYEKNFDVEFRYSFLSIARSFLFRYSDDEIFRIFSTDCFLETSIVKVAFTICKKIDVLSLRDLFFEVIEHYHYLDKILTTTAIQRKENVLLYLNDFLSTFENGDIYQFVDYLDRVIERDYDIKYDNSVFIPNTVKIMSIHKSKGLEFPICYFASLESHFNKREQKEKVIFDHQFGLILPQVGEESKDTVSKILFKRFDTIEEVSERIRLFYVALTRCKEKLILVCPDVEEDLSIAEDIIDNQKRRKYVSFYDILKSIWYKLNKYVKRIEKKEYSREYLYTVSDFSLETDFENCNKIEVREQEFSLEKIESHHYSKGGHVLLSKEEYSKMEFGRRVHEILETIDFQKPDYSCIENDFICNKVKMFLSSDFIQKHLEDTFYKEYEFVYEKEGDIFHGIIDLMIENDTSILIVDYKLKDIEDENYIKQLYGYREYIKSTTNKKVELYLYSILLEEFKSI